MVASSHYLASEAGLAVLRRGGTAVDAAIATNAVLGVVYPHMAGLGGDGFWLIWDPRARRLHALNASGPAARLATIDYYRSHGHGDTIPRRGALAALTVPGAVDGWRLAYEAFGRAPWGALLHDAIGYAREGMPVGRSLAATEAHQQGELRAHLSVARTFLVNGRPHRLGDRLVQHDLADAYERLARAGPRAGFYEGETADRICRALAPGQSPLRPDDFAAYAAEWTEPISSTYRGLSVFELPPNTQGISALEILNLVEGYDIATIGDASADYYHIMAEATKLAFADRDEWVADPRFVRAPIAELASREYAAQRRTLIDMQRSLPYGGVAPGIRFTSAARMRPDVDGGTCYFAVIDADGLVVSAIASVYQEFGAMVIPDRTGIVVQNRGALFSLDPGHANRLEPMKRPFHTLIPAMLLDGDAPAMAFGTMGGNAQPQIHASLLTRMVDLGYDVQQAIEAPRWVMGRTLEAPSKDLWLEGRIGEAIGRELLRRGQPVHWLSDWSAGMGHAHAIRIDHARGFLEGGSDPRSDGAALGY